MTRGKKTTGREYLRIGVGISDDQQEEGTLVGRAAEDIVEKPHRARGVREGGQACVMQRGDQHAGRNPDRRSARFPWRAHSPRSPRGRRHARRSGARTVVAARRRETPQHAAASARAGTRSRSTAARRSAWSCVNSRQRASYSNSAAQPPQTTICELLHIQLR